jgi:hypothetical protein
LFVFNEKQPAAAGFAALGMTYALFPQPANGEILRWPRRKAILVAAATAQDDMSVRAERRICFPQKNLERAEADASLRSA